MIERGYAERIFLSADSVATTDWFPPNVIEGLLAAGAAHDGTIAARHSPLGGVAIDIELPAHERA